MSKRKEECSYGQRCYRLNPIHFKEFAHTHLDMLILEAGLEDEGNIELPQNFKPEVPLNTVKEQIKVLMSIKKHDKKVSDYKASQAGSSKQQAPSTPTTSTSGGKKTVADKWTEAAPYHLFMTNVPSIPDTLKEHLSIGLADLYDKSLGDVEESLQANFMADVNFLLKNLALKQCAEKPMLLLYDSSNVQDLPHHKYNQVKAVCVKPKSMFGHHHTKLCILRYKDHSIRVVVSTANLIEEDWNDYSQGVWISPSCPPVTDSSKGESPSGFRASLAQYLSAYKVKELDKWVQMVRGADFSQVNVCFVGSVPSTGTMDVTTWGLGRLKQLLHRHVASDAVKPEWPALAQCSSIGSLGATPKEWLENELKAAMLGSGSGAHLCKTPLHLVYPCKRDVERSISGGGCLPYAYITHRKQPWLAELAHKWRAEKRRRTLAMPHIKTFTRVSPDWRLAAWFLLTSANLSKAAWGRSTHQGQGQNILSFEAGVLFLPKFVLGAKHFEISHGSSQHGQQLPFPYDLPPTKYDSDDKMWLSDYLQS